MTFYKMTPETLSTFSKTKAQNYRDQGFGIASTEKVRVERLESIADKYLKGKTIDFLSIDTGGLDTFGMQALKSNNWTNHRPRLVCVELTPQDKATEKNRRDKEAYEATKDQSWVFSKNYQKQRQKQQALEI